MVIRDGRYHYLADESAFLDQLFPIRKYLAPPALSKHADLKRRTVNLIKDEDTKLAASWLCSLSLSGYPFHHHAQRSNIKLTLFFLTEKLFFCSSYVHSQK